ncbi:ABC transporter substrate-binding protein [Zhihengliuella salsuginis]|uniref:Sugar ABC transporter substrate-binding protein n=1 Tax=Zhihengliuella salsuginis TaxID=578222 RepID=A0ABQ3GCZ2_9MICC|nr:extracellular solute-binding protein [Zhihengliuella salsuginis]GHD00064.1 sugar ABC transporter substrate-binding protein [Zhihengliuella salsuginis]
MIRRPSKKAALAVGIGAALLLSGCGAGSRTQDKNAAEVPCEFEAPGSATTVNVLAYNSSAIDPFTNTLVANCTTDEVDVVHEPVDFAGQVQRTTTTLAGAEGTYDILETYGYIIPENAESEKILPLNDLIDKYGDTYGLDELSPSMVEAMSYNGDVYAVPMQAQMYIMAYRKDIFDELGLEPPTTFDELRDVAQKIQDSGEYQYPLALPLLASSDIATAYDSALGSLGVDLVDHEAGKPNFDQPEAIQAFEELKSLAPYMDPQVTTFDQPKVQQQMYNGDAAISIMFSGRMNDLVQESNSPNFDKIAFAAPPAVVEGGKQYSTLSVDGWSIPANTSLDEDMLFNMIGSSVSEKASLAAIPAAYPARQGLVTAENSPYGAAANDAIENAPAAEPFPYTAKVSNAVRPVIAEVFTGALTPEEGTAQMQTIAQKVLDAE